MHIRNCWGIDTATYNFQSYTCPLIFCAKFQVSSMILAELRVDLRGKKFRWIITLRKKKWKITTKYYIKYSEISKFHLSSLLGHWYLFVKEIIYLAILKGNEIFLLIKLFKYLLACTALFALDFSKIMYNAKCNVEFMKTATVHFAKRKSIQAISSKIEWFYKNLFFRKDILSPKFEFCTQFFSQHK